MSHPESLIGREEMNQADGYVQNFLGSGALDGTPMFRAFVVGYEIAAKTSREKEIKEGGVLRGRVIATTYGQLISVSFASKSEFRHATKMFRERIFPLE